MRLRAHRPLLRQRALGPAPGHHVDGQGPDERLRADGRDRGSPGTSRTRSPTARCCTSTPTRATRSLPRRRSRRSTCWSDEALVDRAAALEPVLRRELERVREATPRVVAISVIGLLSSVELDVADRDDPQDLLIALRHEMYERGLIARCRGRRRDPDGRVLPDARGVRGRPRVRRAGARRCRRRRHGGGPMTRIVEVREQPVRLEAAIRNSLIDFSQMTVSVVAVITDRVVDGRPVVGLGFNSIGRYAAVRDAPRPVHPPAARRLTPTASSTMPGSWTPPRSGDLADEEREARRARRAQRGGGGRWRSRSGTSPPSSPGVPLYRLLADRYNGGRFDTQRRRLRGGRLLLPRRGRRPARARRCAATSTRATRT